MCCDNCVALAILNAAQSITVTLSKCAVEEQKTFSSRAPSLYLTPEKTQKIIKV